MAETVVCFVLDKLVPLLRAEADLLSGLPTELAAISNELKTIKFFLKDAEQRSDENDGIKEWVRQVRDIAYQIEDVIDEQSLRHYSRDHPHNRCFSIFSKLTRCVVLLGPNHDIASNIKRIHLEIQEINRRKTTFTLADSSPSYGFMYKDSHQRVDQDPRSGFLYVDESELVGIDSPKRDLIRLLDLELQDYPQANLISVVGMGGLGKTTLVRKVFEDMSVQKHFHFRAWITLSRPGNTLHVIRNMMMQFYRSSSDSIPPEINTMDEESLVEELRSYLRERRFLVVFDDVWSIETYMKDVLPTNNNGNKILLTTRLKEVALAWKGSSCDEVYNLQPLSSERAWDLFCRKAFQDPEGKCPRELKKLSCDIVEKCEGLPLAIVTIGGLLSTKDKVAIEWQKLYSSIGNELANKFHLASIKKILLLSYHDLPHYLRPCFLYMGIFPKDRVIELKRLVRLWIAEGFIPKISGKTLEEVAVEYLIELIRRSLVQVTWVDIAKRPRGVRVHDLLREIIRFKSEELSFCHILDKEDSVINGQCRRLGIQNDKVSNMLVIEGTTKKSSLRSLFLFEGNEVVPKLITGLFLNTVHLLKVLDLENAPVTKIPGATGSLYHLQYLSLKRTKVEKLPRSIGKLGNLQTLDLKHSLIQELPVEISRISKLRHLISYSCYWDDAFSVYIRNVRAGKILGAVCLNCPEMQNLGWVDSSHGVGFFEQLENMEQLRRLGVARLKREDGRKLCIAVKNMHYLQAFMVASESKHEILDVDYLSSPPPLLCRLSLVGRLEKLPDWISKLENLVKLVLCNSNLNDIPLEILGALPSPMKLTVSEAYNGERLQFGATRFQKLKVLRLYCLCNLKSIELEPGTLPVLEELQLGPSPQLKEVPTGIKNLKNLALLTFHDMPKAFSDALIPDKGEHYHIIDHVANAYINFKAGSGHWQTTSLRYPQEHKMVALWQ